MCPMLAKNIRAGDWIAVPFGNTIRALEVAEVKREGLEVIVYAKTAPDSPPFILSASGPAAAFLVDEQGPRDVV